MRSHATGKLALRRRPVVARYQRVAADQALVSQTIQYANDVTRVYDADSIFTTRISTRCASSSSIGFLLPHRELPLLPFNNEITFTAIDDPPPVTWETRRASDARPV